MKTKLIFFLLSIALLLNSCAYRFSRSTLPSHLKSINIEPINNKTYQSILADDLLEAIKATFRKEASSLQQVNQNGHCELILELSDYQNKALTFNSSGTVSEYRTTITVAVRFYDRVKDEVLYENKSLVGQGDYLISKGETESLHGQQRAVAQLNDLIVSNLLSQW
jgi:outer membrane lipopolysaccharide assembly protein LptE/RlpB